MQRRPTATGAQHQQQRRPLHNNRGRLIVYAAVLFVITMVASIARTRYMLAGTDDDEGVIGDDGRPNGLRQQKRISKGLQPPRQSGSNRHDMQPPPATTARLIRPTSPAPNDSAEAAREGMVQHGTVKVVAVKTRPSPIVAPNLTWAAADLYLPLSPQALQGFMAHEVKQRTKRSPALLKEWREGWDNAEGCSREVPECDFFLVDKDGRSLLREKEKKGGLSGEGGTAEKILSPSSSIITTALAKTVLPIMRSKCCAEHMKLKMALFYTLDVIDGYNAWVGEEGRSRNSTPPTPSPILYFLDSGALLSSQRDGGMTLIPWETDIDIGLVGGSPDDMMRAFSDGLSAVAASLGEGGGNARGGRSNSTNIATSSVYSRDIRRQWAGLNYANRRKYLPEVHRSDFLKVLGSTDGSGGNDDRLSDESSTYKNLFPSYSTITLALRRGSSAAAREAATANSSTLAGNDHTFYPPHYFEPCTIKKAPKKEQHQQQGAQPNYGQRGGYLTPPPPTTTASSRPHHDAHHHPNDKLLCNDAHYIFYSSSKGGSAKDTSRVELYPFAVSSEGGEATAAAVDPAMDIDKKDKKKAMLIHPTRKWLSVPVDWVLPLDTTSAKCMLWGRRIPCPRRSEASLDLVYGGGGGDSSGSAQQHDAAVGRGGGLGWRRPMTIHWGERNVQPWK